MTPGMIPGRTPVMISGVTPGVTPGVIPNGGAGGSRNVVSYIFIKSFQSGVIISSDNVKAVSESII